MTRASLGAAVAAALAIAALAVACTQGAEFKRVTDVDGPNYAQFRDSVSPYLEVRCGSLDCHGQSGRPLRIYSGRGLRLGGDAGNIAGGGTATSGDERVANWLAVVGLEPETMRRVVEEGGFSPERLLMVTKPRGGQSEAAPGGVIHKGGAVVRRADDGDTCMTTWLAENVDKDACLRAASVP